MQDDKFMYMRIKYLQREQVTYTSHAIQHVHCIALDGIWHVQCIETLCLRLINDFRVKVVLHLFVIIEMGRLCCCCLYQFDLFVYRKMVAGDFILYRDRVEDFISSFAIFKSFFFYNSEKTKKSAKINGFLLIECHSGRRNGHRID